MVKTEPTVPIGNLSEIELPWIIKSPLVDNTAPVSPCAKRDQTVASVPGSTLTCLSFNWTKVDEVNRTTSPILYIVEAL